MSTNIFKVSLMIIFITSIEGAFAQKTFQQADIVKNWKFKNTNLDTPDWFMEFTDTRKVSTYDCTTLLETDYYLSDTIEKTFDNSKVYENTEGKFIIKNNKNCHGNWCVSIYEILSLTDNKLILKYGSFGTIFMYTTNKDSVLYSYDEDVKLTLSLDYESFTQQTFQKKDIANKKWFLVYPNRKYEWYYYLTNNLKKTDGVVNFDASKVGKNTSGKYIIIGELDGFIKYIYEIRKLTHNKLILKQLSPASYNTKTVYQAVEK